MPPPPRRFTASPLAFIAALAMGPTTASGSAWPAPPGTARLSVAYSGLSSRTQFAPGDALGLTGPLCPVPREGGDRMPYSCVTGGRFSAHQATASASVGLTSWLTADLDVPLVIASAFTDDVGTSTARGLGDVRAAARVGHVWGNAAASWVVGAQAPTGPRNFQDREVPIGQGQWDLLTGPRVGLSLWPHGWVETHQHVRLRLKNTETGLRPGSEWVGQLSAGWTPVPTAGLLGGVSWILAAQDTTQFGLKSPGRRLLQGTLGAFYKPNDRLWADVSVGVPAVGRAWPATPTVSASVAYTVGPL